MRQKFEHKQTIVMPLIRKKYYNTHNYHNEGNFFTITIIGGSQGAKIFDTLINELLVKISKICSLKVMHQTSKKIAIFSKNFIK